MSAYDDILNKTWDEIPEVQALPGGSYEVRIISAKFNPEKENGDKVLGANVQFALKPVEAMNDVDGDDLAQLGENYDISANTIFDRVFVDEGGWDRVRRILKTAGVDLSGKTIPESLASAKGKKVVVFLERAPYTDKRTGEEKLVNNVRAYTDATA